MQNQMPWSPTFSFYEAPRENQVEFYTRCELAIHPCIPDVDDLIYEVIMQSIRSQDNMLNNGSSRFFGAFVKTGRLKC